MGGSGVHGEKQLGLGDVLKEGRERHRCIDVKMINAGRAEGCGKLFETLSLIGTGGEVKGSAIAQWFNQLDRFSPGLSRVIF